MTFLQGSPALEMSWPSLLSLSFQASFLSLSCQGTILKTSLSSLPMKIWPQLGLEALVSPSSAFLEFFLPVLSYLKGHGKWPFLIPISQQFRGFSERETMSSSSLLLESGKSPGLEWGLGKYLFVHCISQYIRVIGIPCWYFCLNTLKAWLGLCVPSLSSPSG